MSIVDKIKLISLERKIKSLTAEEKNNINGLINFAISWWLKDVDNINEGLKKKNFETDQPLTEEQINDIENFKNEMGMTILEKLLTSEEEIELSCSRNPYETLDQILKESNCQYLCEFLPNYSYMKIKKDGIWVKRGNYQINMNCQQICDILKTGYTALTEEDYDKLCQRALTEEKIKNIIAKDQVLVGNFVPTNYDFFVKEKHR